ncbi:hypothetical protein L227DRAFT_558971 [Lentinus tigrinus ALCF2SS1-6]|uniref:RING-type domain-containing protein n=1 Tax=Lentinus tigrinus ALCF2SS1-6 TaxID=1328759 RepID=A0A5C2T3T7_9APHY|nr:hypothetical protein L227DRAFT_558971 [Lentinus tigrinus ALCF2SS1-6]
MPPVTRSTPSASSSRHTIVVGPQEISKSAEEDGSTLQTLLRRALGGAKHLERENETLRKNVKALESKLERIQQSDELPVKPKRGKRAAASVLDLQKEVQALKNQVRRLEKLSMREVKKDAEELVDDAEFEVGDSAYKMRKLLREFYDLMEANSLGEEEECPICMEPLELKKCSSLPCQHMFCHACLRKIKPDADSYYDEVESISCPTCRTPCPRDDMETVELTSIQQWDALLDVARKWAKIDMRREEDTSEEEEEEEFIDDAGTNAR